MKRLILLLAFIVTLGPPAAAQSTVYVSPDVPTDPGITVDILPWEVVSYASGSYGPPIPTLSVPGNPAIDALHKLNKPGHWLFSIEASNDLGGMLPNPAEPRDVIRYDGLGAYVLFFCGGSVGGAVPLSSNVDALYLNGGDTADLIVSFDVPTTIGAATYEPADLVRYRRTGAGCSGWTLIGLHFDASLAGAGIPISSNVIGADEHAGRQILSLDIPSDLIPSVGPVTYLPGQLAAWDPGPFIFTTYDTLGGWPLSSQVDALSCQSSPGRVYDSTVYPFEILLDKSTLTPGDLTIYWSPSCTSGAEDYGIYEGILGSFTTHEEIDCFDALLNFEEEITPATVSSYYLVVPYNSSDEGSYGVDYDSSRVPIHIERPQAINAIDRCITTQDLTACPP